MRNKVIVTIGGKDYTMVAAEDEGYVRRCAELVDRQLEEREKLVITLRYGLSGKAPLTQREIAQQCNISRSYVSRIEKKALEKLRIEYEKI